MDFNQVARDFHQAYQWQLSTDQVTTVLLQLSDVLIKHGDTESAETLDSIRDSLGGSKAE